MDEKGIQMHGYVTPAFFVIHMSELRGERAITLEHMCREYIQSLDLGEAEEVPASELYKAIVSIPRGCRKIGYVIEDISHTVIETVWAFPESGDVYISDITRDRFGTVRKYHPKHLGPITEYMPDLSTIKHNPMGDVMTAKLQAIVDEYRKCETAMFEPVAQGPASD